MKKKVISSQGRVRTADQTHWNIKIRLLSTAEVYAVEIQYYPKVSAQVCYLRDCIPTPLVNPSLSIKRSLCWRSLPGNKAEQ